MFYSVNVSFVLPYKILYCTPGIKFEFIHSFKFISHHSLCSGQWSHTVNEDATQGELHTDHTIPDQTIDFWCYLLYYHTSPNTVTMWKKILKTCKENTKVSMLLKKKKKKLMTGSYRFSLPHFHQLFWQKSSPPFSETSFFLFLIIKDFSVMLSFQLLVFSHQMVKPNLSKTKNRWAISWLWEKSTGKHG